MEQIKGYLMLPRGVRHMRALGSFGRLTPFYDYKAYKTLGSNTQTLM